MQGGSRSRPAKVQKVAPPGETACAGVWKHMMVVAVVPPFGPVAYIFPIGDDAPAHLLAQLELKSRFFQVDFSEGSECMDGLVDADSTEEDARAEEVIAWLHDRMVSDNVFAAPFDGAVDFFVSIRAPA